MSGEGGGLTWLPALVYERKGFLPFGRNRKPTERDIPISAGTGITAARDISAERWSFGRNKHFRPDFGGLSATKSWPKELISAERPPYGWNKPFGLKLKPEYYTVTFRPVFRTKKPSGRTLVVTYLNQGHKGMNHGSENPWAAREVEAYQTHT